MFGEDPPGRGDIRPQWLEDASDRSPLPTYDWVYRTWARPAGRLVLAAVFLCCGALITDDLLSDQEEFFNDPLLAFLGIGSAPPIIVGFLITAIQALRDLLGGTNKKPFFISMGQWLSFSAAGKAACVIWLLAVAGIVIANAS